MRNQLWIFIGTLNFNIQLHPLYMYSHIYRLYFYLVLKLIQENINFEERSNIYINKCSNAFFLHTYGWHTFSGMHTFIWRLHNKKILCEWSKCTCLHYYILITFKHFYPYWAHFMQQAVCSIKIFELNLLIRTEE